MTIWDWKGWGREERIQEDGLSNGYRGSPTPRVWLGKSATSGKHSRAVAIRHAYILTCIEQQPFWKTLADDFSGAWLWTCECVSVQGSITLLPQSKDHLLPVLVQCRRWEGRAMHRNSSPVRLFFIFSYNQSFCVKGNSVSISADSWRGWPFYSREIILPGLGSVGFFEVSGCGEGFWSATDTCVSVNIQLQCD